MFLWRQKGISLSAITFVIISACFDIIPAKIHMCNNDRELRNPAELFLYLQQQSNKKLYF